MRRLAILASAALGLYGQQAAIINGRVKAAPVTGTLESSIRAAAGMQNGPAWIGYSVAAQPASGLSCCRDGGRQVCGLERQASPGDRVVENPVRLEASRLVSILYRVERGTVERVAAYAGDCTLDAGGLPVYWLTGAGTAQSVALLARSATNPKLAGGALLALSMHQGEEADSTLETLVQTAESMETRRQAVFWLGQARGRKGYEALCRVVRRDGNEALREHAIFALTLSKEPGAMGEIIRLAREDKSAPVRSKALFWLAQMASSKAVGAIAESVDRDPDTAVKKAAVFALAQLPHGDGIPELIRVAQTNGNREVRKQAIFWLGQSKDERAFRFIESVLTR